MSIDMALQNQSMCNLCYTYMDSLIFHVKSENVYADLAKDFKKRFDR